MFHHSRRTNSCQYFLWNLDLFPECDSPLGMEDKRIADSAIKATTAVSTVFCWWLFLISLNRTFLIIFYPVLVYAFLVIMVAPELLPMTFQSILRLLIDGQSVGHTCKWSVIDCHRITKCNLLGMQEEEVRSHLFLDSDPIVQSLPSYHIIPLLLFYFLLCAQIFRDVVNFLN